MTSNANFDITGVWPNGGALSSPAFWTALKFGLPRRGVSLRRSTGAVAFPSCRPARHLGLRFRTGFSVCRTFMRLGRFAPRRIPAVWGVAGGVSSQIDRSLSALCRSCPAVGGGVRSGAGVGNCDKPKISCRIADFADALSVGATPRVDPRVEIGRGIDAWRAGLYARVVFRASACGPPPHSPATSAFACSSQRASVRGSRAARECRCLRPIAARVRDRRPAPARASRPVAAPVRTRPRPEPRAARIM